MVNVKRKRVIKGDPKRIWELINQVERYPEWMPGVVEANVTSEPRTKKSHLGRKQLLKTNMKFGKGKSLQEVIAWDPPNKITWQHLKDVVDGKEFSQAKEIKTTLSITNNNGEITLRMIGSWQPVGISEKLMQRTMTRTVGKSFELALKNLEKLIKKESR